MHLLKTIVVDDHQKSVEHLLQTIHHTCPQVQVIDQYPVIPDSLSKIDLIAPDLVFFDTGGSKYSGLEILSDWSTSSNVQFILLDSTGIPEETYFSVSVTDYLSKPISPRRLVKAVERVIDVSLYRSLKQDMLRLTKSIQVHLQPNIPIPTMRGYDMMDYRNIIFAEAADNYSILHLIDGNQILCSHSLAKLEIQLCHFPFQRIHRKSLVNLAHICTYLKGDGGQVILSNKSSLNVSRNKKDDLIDKLKNA